MSMPMTKDDGEGSLTADAITHGDADEGAAGSKFSPEMLKVAREVYDKMRMYVPIAPGMRNQIYRNGLLAKKSLDGDGYIRMEGTKNYYRDNREKTPGGSIIIHRDDADPVPGNCAHFIHPPHGSEVQYRAENDHAYTFRCNLNRLKDAAESCGFCSILYQGICSMRRFWICNWARYRWLDSTEAEITLDIYAQEPWFGAYLDEIRGAADIDETAIQLYVKFPKDASHASVMLQIEPSAKFGGKRMRQLGEIEFYSDPEAQSPWATFKPSQHVQCDLSTWESWEQVRLWIQDCEKNHESCRPQTQGFAPSRLVEAEQHVLTDDAGRETEWITLKLIETTLGDEYAYVALSHCWSMSHPFKTIRANLPKHKNYITCSQLSETFQEVAIATLNLGLRYIWIDSLCIVQDDAADWEREAPLMGMIYSNAVIVFTSLGGSLCLKKHPPVELKDALHPNDPAVYCRPKKDHRAFHSPPSSHDTWFGRAWCMQERILGSRMLYFGGTAEELTFECGTGVQCECGQIDLENHGTTKVQLSRTLKDAIDHAGVPSKPALFQLYIKLCEDYSARGLTVPTDKLVAMSSFIQVFQPYFGRYYAGLWEYNFVLCLQWETLNTEHSSRPAEYVAPSFSWASQTGAIVWYYYPDSAPTPKTHDFCEILSIVCTTKTSNSFGQVTEGHLRIRALTTTMMIRDKEWHAPDGRLAMQKADGKKCYVTIDSMQNWESLEAGSEVICADIMRDKETEYVSGLALVPAKQGSDLYRRIGFSTMKKSHFDGGILRDVTII